MLSLDHIKTAIIMMKRAPCKGEEAEIVADTIGRLYKVYETVEQAQNEDAELRAEGKHPLQQAEDEASNDD